MFLNKGQSNLLKLIAVITMVIDHVGYLFFPDIIAFRLIGRISFPIFAFMISQGLVYTKDKNSYLFRIVLIALISQLPYSLLFNTISLNVLFTFACSIIIINFFESKKWYIAIPCFLLIGLGQVDYGLYGFFMVSLPYHFKERNKMSLVAISLITIIAAFTIMSWAQVYAILGIFIIFIISKLPISVKLNRKLFYFFYPAHLIILLFLDFIVAQVS